MAEAGHMAGTEVHYQDIMALTMGSLRMYAPLRTAIMERCLRQELWKAHNSQPGTRLVSRHEMRCTITKSIAIYNHSN